VFRTEDDGRSWTATGADIEPILFETIRVAPSDPTRLYLSGAYPPSGMTPRRPFVHRSDDGGATWTATPFDDLREGDRNIYLLGVDPTDPDRVLMRVRSEHFDRVVESRDAGATWTDRLALPSVDGFAWSSDGADVWVGGRSVDPLEGADACTPGDDTTCMPGWTCRSGDGRCWRTAAPLPPEDSGLFHSSDGGDAFGKVSDVEVGCLAVHDDALWACGNNFSDGFSVGRSADDGRSFEPVFVFSAITGVLECDDDTTARTTCDPLVPDLVFDLGLPIDAGVPPPDGAVAPWLDGGGDDGGGMDGGTVGGGGGGCCSVAAGAAPRAPWWVLWLLLGAARLRRRLCTPSHRSP
jgi:hypothetical protein